MGIVTLSADAGYQSGKPAVGTTVRADQNAIINEVNGNINRDNLQDGEVIAVKLANNAVTAAKLDDNSVYEANVFFGSSGGGLLCPRVGPSYNDEGTTPSAPRITMVSHSFTFPASTSFDITIPIDGTNCVDGAPAFQATPHLLGTPVIIFDTATAADMPDQVWVRTITTANVVMRVERSGSTANAVIIEFGLMGAMS